MYPGLDIPGWLIAVIVVLTTIGVMAIAFALLYVAFHLRIHWAR
jgi:hypothetical protein